MVIEKQITQAITKYPEVHQHSLKVFLLTYAVLNNLPKSYLDKERERNLLVAALLHDIGKGLWPNDWFTLPRREIQETSWLAMQMHPLVGSEFLKSINFNFDDVLDIIAQHHEKPDGFGYPNGVEPPKEALVLSACDMLAAITEEKSYRKAMPIDQALSEIKSQILPEIYQALQKTVEGGK